MGSSHRGSESITCSSACSPAPARDPPRGTLLLYFLHPCEEFTGILMSLTFSAPSSSSFSCVQSCADLSGCSGAASACSAHPELLPTLLGVKWALAFGLTHEKWSVVEETGEGGSFLPLLSSKSCFISGALSAGGNRGSHLIYQTCFGKGVQDEKSQSTGLLMANSPSPFSLLHCQQLSDFPPLSFWVFCILFSSPKALHFVSLTPSPKANQWLSFGGCQRGLCSWNRPLR